MKKPNGPSAPKVFLDTQIVPLATNIAGTFEVALDRAAGRLGVRPLMVLAGVGGLATLSILYLRRRHGRARWV